MSADRLSTLQGWHRLMHLQIEVGFPLELPVFFESDTWKRAKRVADVGTGIGWYLLRLSDYFPQKSFLGIDADRGALEIGKELASQLAANREITFEAGRAQEYEGSFDFGIARLLLQHLTPEDRIEFLRRCGRNLTPGGGLLIIESNDHRRKFHPELPALEGFFQELRNNRESKGVPRDVIHQLPSELKIEASRRLRRVSQTSLTVSSLIPGHKDLFHDTYKSVMDVAAHVLEIPWRYDAIEEELCGWLASDRAYTQLGIDIAEYVLDA